MKEKFKRSFRTGFSRSLILANSGLIFDACISSKPFIQNALELGIGIYFLEKGIKLASTEKGLKDGK